mgnify:CR=1 FL=1
MIKTDPQIYDVGKVLLNFNKISIAHSIVSSIEFMLVLAVTRVGRYHRTTIPREVRKLLGINEDDEIEWVFEGGKVRLGVLASLGF